MLITFDLDSVWKHSARMGIQHRCHLGKFFSEGSRQIWLQLPRAKLRVEEFTVRAGWARGVLSKVMYGDKRPNLRQGIDLSTILGIDPTAFEHPPKRAFVLPAARLKKAA